MMSSSGIQGASRGAGLLLERGWSIHSKGRMTVFMGQMLVDV